MAAHRSTVMPWLLWMVVAYPASQFVFAQSLSAAYPGRCQSLTQVLSTTDARLSGLTEKEA